ncbi:MULTISPECIES: hypothetical protein [Phenylobacterium]|uniref:Uncharacterized protein n=1 Tax=Phenylobacterium koreense TaxID=266125 RepID=A0ABV2EN79_9CAUL
MLFVDFGTVEGHLELQRIVYSFVQKLLARVFHGHAHLPSAA